MRRRFKVWGWCCKCRLRRYCWITGKKDRPIPFVCTSCGEKEPCKE